MYTPIYLFILLLSFSPSNESTTPSAGNEVWGKITMPSKSRKVVRGNTYNKDGSPVEQSNDKMARPDQNVVVSFHPLDRKPQAEPMTKVFMTQQEQTFLPLVLPVTVGSEVTFVNEDQYLHSIQSLNRNMKSVVQKPPGENHPRMMNKPGIVKLGCDIHGHMRGYIWCLNTPYFVRVDEQGQYRITDLPDGRYRLEAFHPDARRMVKREITLRGGEVSQEDVNFAKP